ncbi:hypothetical protein Vadar_031736 [Vaccinium darrowii]|uniref:Uncharacterized protein n=1 Tax=Vaccinium darrowii TaxID=229202 RepID=A0ACB7YA30_9ERIC|nr:hypothetical protein Vadar_031736 [Vaccinium darrowii]
MESNSLINSPPAHSENLDNPLRVKAEENKGGEREGSPPSIRLCLGISYGVYEKPSHVINKEEGKSVFTAGQLQELRQQLLIFKYIASGLPLPIQIISPIWRRVATSLESANGGISNHYPNFIGFSHLRLDHRSLMDAEPGRCRRTDGKKWRCGKDVVPDQKYCERHMHRGRGRSRKLVEASEISSESVPVNLQLATPSPKSSGNNSVAKVLTTSSIGSICGRVNTIDAKKGSTTATGGIVAKALTTSSTGCISGSVNPIDAKKGSTTATAGIVAKALTSSITGSVNNNYAKKDSTTATAATTLTNNGINRESNKNFSSNRDITKSTTTLTPTTTTTTTTGLWSAGSEKVKNCTSNAVSVNGKDGGYKHLNNRINITGSINNGNADDAGSLVASRIGFSPDSVLQVVGCSSLCLNSRNAEETELQRCRRTDGKKWRCGADVVPYNKYCERHMHRGAKKLTVATETVTVAAAAAPLPGLTIPVAIPKKESGCVNLNTNLSISITSSPQQTANEEEKSNTSSSDADTISDENGSVSHMLSLSP